MRVGVDTGGTFTDLVRLDARDSSSSIAPTPDDASRAILEGVGRPEGASRFEVVHGFTVATNAVLERKGARVALVAIKIEGTTAVTALCAVPLSRPDAEASLPTTSGVRKREMADIRSLLMKGTLS